MDAETPGRPAETVKIESRHMQIGQRFGVVQNFQPAQATRMENLSDTAAAAPSEQLGKTLVPVAPDHTG